MTSNKKVSFNELSFAIVPVFKNMAMVLHCPAFISLITGHNPVFSEKLKQKNYILMHCFNSIVVGKDTKLMKKGVIDSINAPPDLPPLKEKRGRKNVTTLQECLNDILILLCKIFEGEVNIEFNVQLFSKTQYIMKPYLLTNERRSYA